ncbi:MAG: response regulator, partial [Microcystaceae cyanobacterium]
IAEPVSQIPYQFLRTLITAEETGKLIIQSPLDEFVSWQVYIGNGKINFANSGVGVIERLSYLLGGYVNQQRIKLPQQLTDDYGYLCDLWKREVFSFQQTRSILSQCTQEALVQILSLPKATCSFEKQSGLKHLFLNLDLHKIVEDVKHKIRFWWELHSEISSPFERPLVDNWDSFKEIFAKKYNRDHHWLEQFSHGLKNLSCLYEIAGQTQTSTLELALMLRSPVKRGEIKMLSYQDIQVDNRPLVVSINQHEGIQQMIKSTLEANGFKTTAILDSFKALAITMSQQPSLILMDANMPDMDGYELCNLLRKSASLQNIPIILLTEQTGLVGRIQGKLAGVSGYLDKPFLPKELISILNKHLEMKIYKDSPPALAMH